MITVKLPSIGCIQFRAEITPDEDYYPDGYDAELRKELDRAQNEHGDWGYCNVTVVASLLDLEGEAHLGGSSYTGERQFLAGEANGYLPGMREEAFTELRKRIEEFKQILPSVEDLNTIANQIQQDLKDSYDRSQRRDPA